MEKKISYKINEGHFDTCTIPRAYTCIYTIYGFVLTVWSLINGNETWWVSVSLNQSINTNVFAGTVVIQIGIFLMLTF